MLRKIITYSIIGAILGSSLGLVLLILSLRSPRVPQEPLNKSLAQPSEAPTARLPDVSVMSTPIPVVNWQTYTNSKFGFSFGYPKTWKLGVKEQIYSKLRATQLSFFFTTDLLDERGDPRFGGFNLVVYENPQNLSLDKWMRNDLEDTQGLLQLVTPKIDIQGAEEVLSVANEEDFYAKKGMGTYTHTDYFIKHEPYIYTLTWFYQAPTYNMKVLENQFFPHFTLAK